MNHHPVSILSVCLISVLLCAFIVLPLTRAWAGPGAMQASTPVGDFAPGRLLIKFRKAVSADTVQSVLDQYSLEIIKEIPGLGVQVIAVPDGQESAVAQHLNRHAAVEYAEPDYIFHAFFTPNDPYYTPYQWNLPHINAPAAWDLTTGSSNVTVAIVDTGVDLSHPDLSSKIVAGYDFVNDDSSPQDDQGHGTHVAGIAAAATNNSAGVAGISWGARIMPVKVLDEEGSGYVSDIADGMRWAADHGALIINLSLGGTSQSSTLQSAVDYAYGSGVLIVAAAGNEYEEGNPVGYPAAYPHVMAVAATDDQDGHASYSNTGFYVDIAAPGGDPAGSWDTNPRHWIMSTYWRGGGADYEQHSGTSMAAPHVAGLAALVWSRHDGWTNDDVEWAMEYTAVDLGTAGRDDVFGYGRIDAYAAVALVEPPPPPTCLAESAHPYANNTNYTWTVTNPDTAATYSRVHFSRLETESGWDYVIVRDGAGNESQRFDGDYPGGVWSNPVPGRVVQVQLLTDGSVTDWGFCLDVIETAPPPAWEMLAALSVARSRLALCAANGKLYAIGGESASSLAAGKGKESPGPEVEQTGILDIGGVVEEYNPATNTWARKASMPTPLSNVACGVIDGKIYVPGGYRDDTAYSTVQVYDPATDRWSAATPLPIALLAPAVAVVEDKLYVIGGIDSTYLRTCYRYDPATNTWTQRASMNYARAWAAASVVHGKIYVVGGTDDTDDLNYVEEYNPATDSWTVKAAMSTARAGPGAVGVGDYLYVAGGGWSTYLSTAERYNPATNSWELIDPMNVGRRTLGLTELGGKLYAVGGWNGAFVSANESYTVGPVLEPDIEVSPPSFDITLCPGQSTQRTMTIENTGQGTLSFDIHDVETSSDSQRGPTIPTPPAGEVDAAGNLVDSAGWDWGALRKGWKASVFLDILHFGPSTEPPRLTALGATVTSITDPSVISEAYLDQFDVFYVGYAAEKDYGSLASKATAIQNYISGGGGVILEQPSETGYQCQFLPAGFEVTVADTYWPGYPSSHDPLEFTSAGQTHPMLQGLTPYDLSYNFDTVYDWDLGNSYTRLARLVWYPNVIALAVGQYGNGRIVFHTGNIASNSYGPGSDSYVEQMLEWVADDDASDALWLSENPSSGTVAPGDSGDVTITFDATDLTSGTYTADIIVESNDPDEGQITVPVTLSVGTGGQVAISVLPAPQRAAVGEIFTLGLQIASGEQLVDAVDAYLSFDPAYLRVVDASGNETNSIIPGSALPLVLQNSADNSSGRITFSAGRQLGTSPPSGDFVLATIRFKAMAETGGGGTPVSFLEGTDVFYQGESILQASNDGSVIVESAPLAGRVTLQGRGNPPSSRWEGYPVRVNFYAPGGSTPLSSYQVTLDTSGNFTVIGPGPGSYDVSVKNPHSLSNRKANVTLPTGTTIDFGTLLEGDASDNDRVAGEDFSILATAYGTTPSQPGWDARADFNGDEAISGADFSLLATNYGRQGPIPVASALSPLRRSPLADVVNIRIDPPGSTAAPGELFTVDIALQAGSQPVDAVDAYLSFDPTYLRVVDAAGNETTSITPGSALPLVLQNSADNSTGRITFSAGRQLSGSPPSGDFVLATIRFKAMAGTGAGGTPVNFMEGTDVFSQGESVLGTRADGVVIISGPTLTPTPTPTGEPPTPTPTPTPTRKPPTPTSTPTITPGIRRLYLPLILHIWPPLPEAPILYTISNPDNDGDYDVSWSTAARANTYQLQEDDNGSFGSPIVVYQGPGTQQNFHGRSTGTYYYRVRGENGWGHSRWSDTRSVSVRPPPTHTPTRAPTPTPTPTVGAGWTNIMTQNFEGSFPTAGWEVKDLYSGYGEYHWGKRNCRARGGSYSAWAVGGGANGSGLSCGANYPNYVYSWMVYGPFSLANASDAELQFYYWLRSESRYDGLFWGASINDDDFYGGAVTGTQTSWTSKNFDLTNVPTLGDLRGRSSVWIAFVFIADFSITYPEGAHVDDIVLRKKVSSGNVSVSPKATPPPNEGAEQGWHLSLARYPGRGLFEGTLAPTGTPPPEKILPGQ